MPGPAVDGAILRQWRLSRGWDVSRLAREFIKAADEPLATLRGLMHMINAWERGARRPSERHWLLYLRVFPERASGEAANGRAEEAGTLASEARRQAGELPGIAEINAMEAAALSSPSNVDPAEIRALAATARARAELRGLAGEQAALRRVSALVARSAPPEGLFAAVTEEAGRLLDADVMGMSRYDPDGAHTLVATWTSTGAAVPVPVGTRFGPGGHNGVSLVFRTGRARIDSSSATPRARLPRPAARWEPVRRSPCRSQSRAAVGRHEHRVDARAAADRHRGPAGRVHRAGRHCDRQRRGTGGADRLPSPPHPVSARERSQARLP